MTTLEERAAYARRVRRLKAYGRWNDPFVDAASTRAHLRALAAAGLGTRRVAELTGLGSRTVWSIREDRQGRVRRSTERAITAIAVEAAALAPGCRIPAVGARRRLQALQVRGFTTADLAADMHAHPATIARLLTADRVTVATHERVAATFDRLWAAQPVATTATKRREIEDTKRRAAAAGWAPPLAWDDIDTDTAPDQGAEPVEVDEIAIDLAIAGENVTLTREERHQALLVLHRRGHYDRELAQRLGVDVKTIERDRKHLGLRANYWTEHEAAA